MEAHRATDLERMRDESVARVAASGERILADEVYVVTPDGKPNLNRWLAYLFIEPDHLWRADWLPETAGFVTLVRDDHSELSYHHVWSMAAGLLGVSPYVDPANPFREVLEEDLQAATAKIVAHMSKWSDDTFATVSVPPGFTVHIVQPGLVYGTHREHGQYWRTKLGVDSDPGPRPSVPRFTGGSTASGSAGSPSRQSTTSGEER